MKKFISLILSVSFCLSILFVFSGCVATHPIEQFKKEMEEADSYKMTMVLYDVPFFGTVTIQNEVDGDIEHTTSMGEETYIETVGDVEYEYTKDELTGKWTKSKKATEESDDSILEEEAFFNPDNYEAVQGQENTYKQKAGVVFEDYEDVVITINEDSYIIEMISLGEMSFKTKITITKINEIELTLPKV